MIYFKFICWFPNIEEANCRVEAVEDCERHWNVSDYHPSPLTVENQVRWAETCMSFYQRVYEPHWNIGDEKECDDLTTRSEWRNVLNILCFISRTPTYFSLICWAPLQRLQHALRMNKVWRDTSIKLKLSAIKAVRAPESRKIKYW